MSEFKSNTESQVTTTTCNSKTADTDMAGCFAKTETGDVVYVDYDYADGKIANCHGLGKQRSFPVLKSDLTKLSKYTTVAQRVFDKPYNYITRGKAVFCVTNHDNYLNLYSVMTDGAKVDVGPVAFMYQIPSSFADTINIVCQGSQNLSYYELLGLQRSSQDYSRPVVSMFDDVSDYDLFAEAFSINYYS